jgi:hypothetical protein
MIPSSVMPVNVRCRVLPAAATSVFCFRYENTAVAGPQRIVVRLDLAISFFANTPLTWQSPAGAE